jgi:hypothetical protein
MDFSLVVTLLTRNEISLDNGDNTGAFFHLLQPVGADPCVGPHNNEAVLNEKACITQAASWNPFSHSIRALTS